MLSDEWIEALIRVEAWQKQETIERLEITPQKEQPLKVVEETQDTKTNETAKSDTEDKDVKWILKSVLNVMKKKR